MSAGEGKKQTTLTASIRGIQGKNNPGNQGWEQWLLAERDENRMAATEEEESV